MAYQPGKAIVECPFCHKICVIAFHKPSFLQGKTTRISAGAKTVYKRIDEKYFIQGDCPNCGAKEKDIQKWYDGEGEKKKLTKGDHKKIIERFKKQGLPTRIEF